jgi:Insertion element 4 transposase N-terminal/Transposase DDE domain
MTLVTIPQERWDGKICQQIDPGLLTEVLPPTLIEELLEASQMWEARERQLNMVAITYWLIGLHLYPHLSQRAVYARLVSGLRTIRDDVPEAIPVKSAFSYRREQLGSEVLEELFAQVAGPKATAETPGAFWKGLRLLALDGTVESVPDTPSNRIAFRYSTDDEQSHSPFPQVRLVLLVECGTHLICDAELSSCRQGEASSTRLLLERWTLEHSLLLWDSGFHSSWAIFRVRKLGGQVLGRLKKNVLLNPFVHLADGSYLTHLFEDQDHQKGASMLVRVISYVFTDPRLPGAGEQVYRLVTTLLDPFLYPAKELAVLFHERWQVELVIGESRTALRLSARTLRSLTPQGVVQELFALLLAHTVVRTVMLQAAKQDHLAPTDLSFTATLRILDETLVPLGLVAPARREQMVRGVLLEIGRCRLPRQRLRIQARVVKRTRSRYARKKPEHWHAPPLEDDLDLHQIIALVT